MWPSCPVRPATEAAVDTAAPALARTATEPARSPTNRKEETTMGRDQYPTWLACGTCGGTGLIGPYATVCRDCRGSGVGHA